MYINVMLNGVYRGYKPHTRVKANQCKSELFQQKEADLKIVR